MSEEYRTFAACASEDGLRVVYLRLADDYDVLAEELLGAPFLKRAVGGETLVAGEGLEPPTPGL